MGSIALVGAGGGVRVIVWFMCHLYLQQTSQTITLLGVQCLFGVTNFSSCRGRTQVGKCEIRQRGAGPPHIPPEGIHSPMFRSPHISQQNMSLGQFRSSVNNLQLLSYVVPRINTGQVLTGKEKGPGLQQQRGQETDHETSQETFRAQPGILPHPLPTATCI